MYKKSLIVPIPMLFLVSCLTAGPAEEILSRVQLSETKFSRFDKMESALKEYKVQTQERALSVVTEIARADLDEDARKKLVDQFCHLLTYDRENPGISWGLELLRRETSQSLLDESFKPFTPLFLTKHHYMSVLCRYERLPPQIQSALSPIVTSLEAIESQAGTSIEGGMEQFTLLLLDMFMIYADLFMTLGLPMDDNPRFTREALHTYFQETWISLIKDCSEEAQIKFASVPKESVWLSKTLQHAFPSEDGEWHCSLRMTTTDFTNSDKIRALDVISLLNTIVRS